MRRIMWTLWELFVDDSCMVDLMAGRGTAQQVGKEVFAALGVPLAEPKSQRMGMHTDFLGVTHDLSVVLTRQCIPHAPKQAMQDKLRLLIEERTEANECTPAQASKLYARGCQQRSSSAWEGW